MSFEVPAWLPASPQGRAARIITDIAAALPYVLVACRFFRTFG
jgi:hypothetical protein